MLEFWRVRCIQEVFDGHVARPKWSNDNNIYHVPEDLVERMERTSILVSLRGLSSCGKRQPCTRLLGSSMGSSHGQKVDHVNGVLVGAPSTA